MGMQYQLLFLTAYIVNCGMISVQQQNPMTEQEITTNEYDEREVRENLQNLFNSIAKSNTKNSGNYRKILKHEVARQQQAFDLMKEELHFARNMNANKNRNFHQKSNVLEYVVARKRETGMYEDASDRPEYFAHKYRLAYAIWVIEAENQTLIPPADVHICQQTNEEKLKMCKEAMHYPIAIQHKITLVEGHAVGEPKTYEIKLGGPLHFNKTAVFHTACLCPTDPPIYLRDNSSGVFVDAYLAFRQDYGEIPDRKVPW